jgi:glutathione S-transferase
LFRARKSFLPGNIADDELWENRISIVTVEISDRNGGTELRLRNEQLPDEESREGHNRGWNSVLDRLEKFVSR